VKSTINLSTKRKPRLFLGLPTYAGLRYNLMPLIGALMNQQAYDDIISMEVDSSLLASGFNLLLVNALNRRDRNQADQFLLMHSDIVPLDTQHWLDRLAAAKANAKAEVISAVVPIKDHRGVTSTAIDTTNIYAPRRLTIRECNRQPETFTHEKLLINTGMLLMDLRNDWVDKLCFTIGDAILITDQGKRLVGSTPEDWDVSRQLRSHGVKLWATKAVALNHVGRFAYPNAGEWGTEQDPGDVLSTGEAPVAK
jgi:hypothetical protein